MTNEINFYSKMDYILEFLNKKSFVCVWEFESLSASSAGQQTTWRQRVYQLVHDMQRQWPR